MADLSGFSVSSPARDEWTADTALVCCQCAARGQPDVVATTDSSVPFSETLDLDPTLADLVAAANRHTWAKHRHPRL